MDTVFEALFLLAVGLLAITITVFVLAVSLLGKAIKQSIQEQSDEEKEGIKKISEKIEEIKNKLDNLKPGHANIEELRLELNELERQQQKHNRKLNWIKTKPVLLRVNGGVLLPGSFFLISIIFSILARYFLVQDPQTNVVGYCFGAIGFIILGLIVVIQSLKVVEGVAITSEETAFTREVEALKTALKEIDDEKKPELILEFKDSQPPFHVKADSEIQINFRILLSKGYIAKNPFVAFWAPKTFTFLEKKAEFPTRYEKYIDFISCMIETEDINDPIEMNDSIKMKTPSQPEIYTLVYRLYCEGFYSEYKEFEVVVE